MAERLTDTGMSNPDRRRRTWASSASRITHSVSLSMSPLRSAKGMKAPGGDPPVAI